MRTTKKKACRVHNGDEAMTRIEEAGELIEPFIGPDAEQAVLFACMDLELEAIELLYELQEGKGAPFVREWLVSKRHVLFAYLKKRGLENSEDVQFAFRKIEAILKWVDTWERT